MCTAALHVQFAIMTSQAIKR